MDTLTKSAHSISMPFRRLPHSCTTSRFRHGSQEFDLFRLQVHHIIRHHSQELNLFRLHL